MRRPQSYYDKILEEGKKPCERCNVVKSLSEFYPYRQNDEKYKTHKNYGIGRGKCKTCEYEIRSMSESLLTRRKSTLIRNYKISIDEWNKIFMKQDYKCAICKTDNCGKRYFNTDHCHINGNVRGILCGNCNRALGYFKDNLDILKAAVNYLNIHKKRQD